MKKKGTHTNKENLEKAIKLGFIDSETSSSHLEELHKRNTKNEKIIKKKTKELKSKNFKFTKEQIKIFDDTPIIILNPFQKPNYV